MKPKSGVGRNANRNRAARQLPNTADNSPRKSPDVPGIEVKPQAGSVGHALYEMDSACEQVRGLLVLLTHEILCPSDAGEYSEAVKCGIVELECVTVQRLESAAAALRSLCALKGGAR
jgi:hypothetical protein